MDDDDKPNPFHTIEPRSASHGVWLAFKAAERLDEIYETTQGEITEDAEAADAMVQSQGGLALDALAEYIHAQRAVISIADTEAERLKAVKRSAAHRIQWASDHILRLLDGRKSYQAGTRKISTRASVYVQTPDLSDEALERVREFCRETRIVKLMKGEAKAAILDRRKDIDKFHEAIERLEAAKADEDPDTAAIGELELECQARRDALDMHPAARLLEAGVDVKSRRSVVVK
jgi:exoribonuclease II